MPNRIGEHFKIKFVLCSSIFSGLIISTFFKRMVELSLKISNGFWYLKNWSTIWILNIYTGRLWISKDITPFSSEIPIIQPKMSKDFSNSKLFLSHNVKGSKMIYYLKCCIPQLNKIFNLFMPFISTNSGCCTKPELCLYYSSSVIGKIYHLESRSSVPTLRMSYL